MRYTLPLITFFLGLLVSNAAAQDPSECQPCPPPPTCPIAFVGPPLPCSNSALLPKDQLIQAQKTLELLQSNNDLINSKK